jgi:hypothetical protein
MEILYEEEGRGYLGLSFEPYMKQWVLHVKFDLSLWGSTTEIYNIIKYCLGLFTDILNELRSRGIKEVIGLCSSEKEAKFNKIFGFKDTGLLAITPEGYKLIILKLEV